MVKIFEVQQQVTNIKNYQSRIIECESFQDYLEAVDGLSLPPQDSNYLEVYEKHVNNVNQSLTFMFKRKAHEGKWIEFTHFAQVIDWQIPNLSSSINRIIMRRGYIDRIKQNL